MMLPSAMAQSIFEEMEFPGSTDQDLIGWSTGVITHIQTQALVNFAPGLITGTCPPGGPLANGAGSGGLIVGLVPSTMAELVIAGTGYPFVSPLLLIYCTQITTHIMTNGLVSFQSGNINGSCTNSPLTPGALAAGEGINGTISGLDGILLANNIHAAAEYPGTTSDRLKEFCTAMMDYIKNNASVTFLPGTVNGTCPVGGGDLIAGEAVGGTIL